METTLGTAKSLFLPYEVLEQIFTHLDHVSLRQARQVNSFWHSVMAQNTLLCTRYRQRLRMRELRILLLGAANVRKRELIKKWCRLSHTQRIGRPSVNCGNVRMPETDGEVWIAQMEYFDGEGGLELLEKRFNGNGPPGGFVLIYEAGSRFSFEEIARWWRNGQLNVENDEFRKQASCAPESFGRVKAAQLQVYEAWRELAFSSVGDRAMPYELAQARLDATRLDRTSTADRKPVLLALIATKDLTEAARVVDVSEGEALADELGVPFFEVSFSPDHLQSDLHRPLRTFWRTYRDGWMKTKIERQKRAREGSEALTDSLNVDQEMQKGSNGKGLWDIGWSWCQRSLESGVLTFQHAYESYRQSWNLQRSQ